MEGPSGKDVLGQVVGGAMLRQKLRRLYRKRYNRTAEILPHLKIRSLGIYLTGIS
jgi:hypothetical protein